MNDLIVAEKLRRVAKAEGAGTRQRSVADYAPGLQHCAERVYGVVQQAPRPGFTKASVRALRGSLEPRGLGSSSISLGCPRFANWLRRTTGYSRRSWLQESRV